MHPAIVIVFLIYSALVGLAAYRRILADEKREDDEDDREDYGDEALTTEVRLCSHGARMCHHDWCVAYCPRGCEMTDSDRAAHFAWHGPRAQDHKWWGEG